MLELLSDPTLSRILLRAAVVGALVSLAASMLGVTMVLRRMSMIGDGLAHAGFGALAVATLLGAGDMDTEISIPIVMAASLLLFYISESGILGGDAAIAVVSTAMMTVGVLIFSFTTGYTADMCSSLFGSASILTITDGDLYLSIALAAVVAAVFIIFYTRIFAVTFDEKFCAAAGVRVWFYKMITAALISLTVVVGMKMIGSLMISALIVFPALSAMRFCKSFRSVLIAASTISVVGFLLGFFMSCELSTPAGASVVAVDLLIYVIISASTAIFGNRQKSRAVDMHMSNSAENSDK